MIRIKKLSNHQKKLILVRDNFTCQKCKLEDKTAKKLEIHHIKPLHLDGTNDKKNLITLCYVCHKYAPNKEDEFKEYLKSECDGELTLLVKTIKSFKESEEGKKLLNQIDKDNL